MPKTVSPCVPAGRMAAIDQPVIAARGGLRLRPWHETDAKVLFDAHTDAGIRHWHGRTFESVDEAAEHIAAGHVCWSDEKGANWAVVRRDDPTDDAARGAIVARIGLSFIDLAGGVAEISYWVLPAERGAGVALAATAALTEWSFEAVGLHRLEIMHSTENAPSCVVAERAGFTAEGTLRSYQLHDDGWHDMHLHSRLRSD